MGQYPSSDESPGQGSKESTSDKRNSPYRRSSGESPSVWDESESLRPEEESQFLGGAGEGDQHRASEWGGDRGSQLHSSGSNHPTTFSQSRLAATITTTSTAASTPATMSSSNPTSPSPRRSSDTFVRTGKSHQRQKRQSITPSPYQYYNSGATTKQRRKSGTIRKDDASPLSLTSPSKHKTNTEMEILRHIEKYERENKKKQQHIPHHQPKKQIATTTIIEDSNGVKVNLSSRKLQHLRPLPKQLVAFIESDQFKGTHCIQGAFSRGIGGTFIFQ